MSRAVVLRIAIATSITVLSASAHATPRVVLDAHTVCPSAKALKAALKTHAKDALGTVHVRPTGDQKIAIRYVPRGNQPEQRRTLEVPGSCESVPDAIALLVQSWSQLKLAEVPPRTTAHVGSSGSKKQASQSTVTASTQTAGARENGVDGPVNSNPQPGDEAARSSHSAETEVTVVESGGETHVDKPGMKGESPGSKVESAASNVDSPGTKLASNDTTVDAKVESPAVTAPVSEPRLRSGFNVLLSGSGSTLFRHDGNFDPVISSGGLRFEFPIPLLRHLGGAAQVRLEGTRSGLVSNGTATTSVIAGDLLLRYDFHDPGRSGPGLTAGLGLQRISAAASGDGIDTSGVQTLYDPELAATAEWHQVLAGGFFARAMVGTEVRARTEVFGIQQDGSFVGPTHVLYRTGWSAGLGLGWAF